MLISLVDIEYNATKLCSKYALGKIISLIWCLTRLLNNKLVCFFTKWNSIYTKNKHYLTFRKTVTQEDVLQYVSAPSWWYYNVPLSVKVWKIERLQAYWYYKEIWLGRDLLVERRTFQQCVNELSYWSQTLIYAKIAIYTLQTLTHKNKHI